MKSLEIALKNQVPVSDLQVIESWHREVSASASVFSLFFILSYRIIRRGVKEEKRNS